MVAKYMESIDYYEGLLCHLKAILSFNFIVDKWLLKLILKIWMNMYDNIFIVLYECLNKFEMNTLSMKYPKKSKNKVNKVFWYLKNLNKIFEMIWEWNLYGKFVMHTLNNIINNNLIKMFLFENNNIMKYSKTFILFFPRNVFIWEK